MNKKYSGSVTVEGNEWTDGSGKYYSAVITINKLDENNQYRLWDKEAVEVIFTSRAKMFNRAWKIMEDRVKGLNA